MVCIIERTCTTTSGGACNLHSAFLVIAGANPSPRFFFLLLFILNHNRLFCFMFPHIHCLKLLVSHVWWLYVLIDEYDLGIWMYTTRCESQTIKKQSPSCLPKK